MSEPPLIDRETLDLLYESIGSEGTRSVLELFIGESRLYLATIAEASGQPSDAPALDRARRAAHALKSGAGQVGAALMSEAALAVELAAAGAMAELPQLVTALQEGAERTLAALTQLLEEG